MYNYSLCFEVIGRILIAKLQITFLTTKFWDKKKGHRCDPTFVNLKSNTMKNTLQR